MTPEQEVVLLTLALVAFGIILGVLGVIVWATRPWPDERAAHEQKHRDDQAEITRLADERDGRHV